MRIRRRYDPPKREIPGLAIGICIIIAALIIIGGYIAYVEYNKAQLKNEIRELLMPRGGE